tara:strand:+ start:644 stop:2074 length:1431 start_codon:yes stop_codon:yes gene_type:complete
MLNKKQSYLLLLTLCLLSRAFTSIYYIEDIDSLRFALSLQDFNVIKLQPHFPGYAIFCFLAKIIYFFTNSMGMTFSIIGGLSVFIIIHFIIKICKVDLNTRIGLFCSVTVFLNPLIWLMSNRYMPDLFGLSVAVSAIYYLIEKNNKIRYLKRGYFLAGILAGTRLSYLPILFIPLIYQLYSNKNRASLFLSLSIGCLIWIIPLIWVSGIGPLYEAATIHTQGHFTNFGGTFITESNWLLRLISLFKGLWGDGLAGYWIGRSWQTVVLSICLVYLMKLGFTGLKKYYKFDDNLKLIIFSVFVYLIWIFFFQNIIHKSRHILPVLMIVFIILVLGQKYVSNPNSIILNSVLCIYFISSISISTNLILQHKKPSAIAQLNNSISELPGQHTIVSIPLINFYLQTHGLKANFINVETVVDLKSFKFENPQKVLLIGNFNNTYSEKYSFTEDDVFFHNPYVNKMWPIIKKYRVLEKGFEVE